MKKKFATVLAAMLFVVLCFALSACNVDVKHTHTISTDDGDCTTADACTACQEVISAKLHVPDENWSKDETWSNVKKIDTFIKSPPMVKYNIVGLFLWK